MHEFYAHTLVDITLNGKLQRPFPFESDSGEMIQDKESLLLAKSQNSNFNTLLQLLQIRGNIVYENGPMKIEQTLGNTAFGCLLYTSPSPRDRTRSRMPSSA